MDNHTPEKLSTEELLEIIKIAELSSTVANREVKSVTPRRIISLDNNPELNLLHYPSYSMI